MPPLDASADEFLDRFRDTITLPVSFRRRLPPYGFHAAQKAD